jgi:predicted MFS family arabinose efflux permease
VLSSLLVDALGWRVVVGIFAVLVALMIPLVRRALRSDVALTGIGRNYGSLLLSTLRLGTQSAPLRQGTLMHFFAFATFISLWTVMVLHLTSPPFGWSVAGAGLFGLVGLASGAVTPFAGRFIDRFGALPVGGVAFLIMLAGAVSIAFDSSQIILFAVSVFVLTLGNQIAQSANQNRAMQTNPQAPAQANTLFMVGVFLGGSLGAVLGPLAYGIGGMALVGVQSVVLVLITLAVWAVAWRSGRGRASTRSATQSDPNREPAIQNPSSTTA